MNDEDGFCGKCKRSFSLTEVRIGRCPWPDCKSEDIYARNTSDKQLIRHIGRRFNTDADRTVNHQR